MMRWLWLVLVTVWPSFAAGQVASGVYRWETLAVEHAPEGDVRRILQGSTTDLDDLRIRAVTLLPGGEMSASTEHRGHEVMVILKQGSLGVSLAGAKTDLGPGSVAVIMPGDAYGLENAGSQPATYFEFSYRAKAPADTERARRAGGSFVVNWDDVEFRETSTGGRRQIFDRPTAMFDRFEMHVTTLNAGLTSHAPHTHPAAEMVLMLRGETTMTIADHHQTSVTGDLIVLESLVPHALDNTGDGPAEYFAFQWQ